MNNLLLETGFRGPEDVKGLSLEEIEMVIHAATLRLENRVTQRQLQSQNVTIPSEKASITSEYRR